MFIVQPFVKETGIRSILGFMSLATKWGDYLFPGITVLTRDLHDVKAMHEVAVQMEVAEVPPRRAEFQRHDTDRKIAGHLSRDLKREGVNIASGELIQRMSYWQRYGSLIDHFDILSDRRPRSIDSYRKMIFEKSFGPGKDIPEVRKRRIRHFKWYRNNRAKLMDEPKQMGTWFRGEQGAWRRWWLTGLNPPAKVPKSVWLVRELEFFLVVWQTLFEASVLLLSNSGKVNSRVARTSRPLEKFLEVLLNLRLEFSPEDCRHLISLGLRLHEDYISPRLDRWERDVSDLMGVENSIDRFTTLHNGRSLTTLGARESMGLLEALAELHVRYCELQNKNHVISVHSFKDRVLGSRLPVLSSEFTSTHWGLFSYRLQASLTLWESHKYQDWRRR